jgi:hypothetical protein
MSDDGEVRTGASGRDYTVKTSAKAIDSVRGVLRERATVTTQAVFWKIPRSSGYSDLSLNLGGVPRSNGLATIGTAPGRGRPGPRRAARLRACVRR